VNINESIQIVTEYLEASDVIVQFERGTVCGFWKSKQNPLITMNTNIKGNNRLFVLLHEAGHYLSFKQRNKLDMLLEEQVAWEKGEELAKNLNIPLDSQKYWRYANRCLNAYLEHRLKNAS
jgi:Zn-dependent peptidase ImmA (M78 family)